MTVTRRELVKDRALQVVWPKPWIAEEFEAAGVDVIRHLGLGPDPVIQRGPIWWSTVHAASSYVAGHEVALTAPNWVDLLRLPKDLFGRKVWVSTAQTLTEIEGLIAFVKSADSKIDGPGTIGLAQVADVKEWAGDVLSLGVPRDTPVIVSDVVEWISEWRVWTDGLSVRETSLYRTNRSTWDEWPRISIQEEGMDFAEECVKAVAQPAVIDIGQFWCDDLIRWGIVETNPVWSSGPYTSDFSAIYDCIKASYDWSRQEKGRPWSPDPWLLKLATKNLAKTNRPESKK